MDIMQKTKKTHKKDITLIKYNSGRIFFSSTVSYDKRKHFDWNGYRECIMLRSRHNPGVAA